MLVRQTESKDKLLWLEELGGKQRVLTKASTNRRAVARAHDMHLSTCLAAVHFKSEAGATGSLP